MTLEELLAFLGQGGGMAPTPPMGGAVPGAAYKTPEQLEAMMGLGAQPPPIPSMMPPAPMEAPVEEAPITSYPPMTTPPQPTATRAPLPGALGADEFFTNFATRWNPEQEVDPMTSLMDRLGQRATPAAPQREPVRATTPFAGLQSGATPRQRMVMPAPSEGERRLRSAGLGRPVERLNWLRGLQSQRGY